MDWRYKAGVSTVFSHAPFGHRMYVLFQRRVTRTLPVSDTAFVENVEFGREHLALLQKHEARPISALQFFEFGVGQDLKFPLTFHSLGVERQILVDLRRLLRPSLVNSAVERLRRFGPTLGLPRVPSGPVEGSTRADWDRWASAHGLDYRAPADARSTGLPDRSVDVVTSISVLEHVPPDDILAILRECRRILKDDGWAVMNVDYTDHYASFDRTITHYNFLRFSEREWRRWNPSMIYQNRLRHSEYLDIVRRAGFEIVDEVVRRGSKEDVDLLRTFPLHEKYRGFSPEDLAVKGWHCLLRKAA